MINLTTTRAQRQVLGMDTHSLQATHIAFRSSQSGVAGNAAAAADAALSNPDQYQEQAIVGSASSFLPQSPPAGAQAEMESTLTFTIFFGRVGRPYKKRRAQRRTCRWRKNAPLVFGEGECGRSRDKGKAQRLPQERPKWGQHVVQPKGTGDITAVPPRRRRQFRKRREEMAQLRAGKAISPHTGSSVDVRQPILEINIRLPDGRTGVVVGEEDRSLHTASSPGNS